MNSFSLLSYTDMARPKGVKKTKSPKIREDLNIIEDLNITVSAKSFRLPSISLSSLSVKSLLSKASLLRKNRYLISFIGIVLFIGLTVSVLYFKRHWFVVAIVDNRPVTSIEVMSRMYNAYKKNTINQIVNERIIFNEAKKQGAMPTRLEIQNKVSEIEERFGGKSEFEKLLTENGQTRLTLEKNIKTVLAMEKMYAELLTVTDEDINTYLKENTVKGTDDASRREEAKNAAREKKLDQLYTQKIQELTEKAKIKIF